MKRTRMTTFMKVWEFPRSATPSRKVTPAELKRLKAIAGRIRKRMEELRIIEKSS